MIRPQWKENNIWMICWGWKFGTSLPPSWNLLTWWGVDHSDRFKHHPSASPAIIVWKLVDQHLFLNLIPINFMAGTWQKVWCDRPMSGTRYICYNRIARVFSYGRSERCATQRGGHLSPGHFLNIHLTTLFLFGDVLQKWGKVIMGLGILGSLWLAS